MYEDIIIKWEPKLHKMLQSCPVIGISQEDVLQEMRETIIKSVKGFDPERNVKFHTYLHKALLNTLLILRSKAHSNLGYNYLKKEDQFLEKEEDWSFIQEINLTMQETLIMDLVMCGYKKSELYKMTNHPEFMRKTYLSLRKKLKNYGEKKEEVKF